MSCSMRIMMSTDSGADYCNRGTKLHDDTRIGWERAQRKSLYSEFVNGIEYKKKYCVCA